MASIVRQKVGGQTYLYESVSFRNSEGKPRNRRALVGKIDKKSGLAVYKQEYIDRMKGEGVIIESAECAPVFSVEDIHHSSILQTGMIHLLLGIARQIGLTDILEQAFGSLHERVFALACFLLCCGEPVSYCAGWMERSDSLGVGPLSSQRISELLNSIDVAGRQRFFSLWSTYRREQEFLALDITSISSYSQLIEDVEWGYNRDKEKLPQINLCMLLGQQSRLPVRMSVYNGSIKDVSTLQSTIAQMAPVERKQVMIVTDKGFSSKKNITLLLQEGVRFLMALPFTLGFACQQVDRERKDIETLHNTLVVGSDTLYGVSKERVWGKNQKLFVQVYYNALKATSSRNDLYGHVRQLELEARKDPLNKKLQQQFRRYLIIRKSEKQEGGYTINFREEIIEQELKHAGWLVTLSNHISDAQEALTIYREKDVVEKGFLRIKHSLGLDRLRVHSQQTMESKVFVGFIALILSSHIHRVMLKEGLYRNMTMKDLIRTMEKLRTQVIDGRRILFPLTKRQKNIYKTFGILPPA